MLGKQKFSFAKKYGAPAKIFDIDPSGFEYYSLEEVYNELLDKNNNDEETVEQCIIPVCGLYINRKSEYGEQPMMASESEYINLPSHILGVVKEILKDSKAIEAINNGNVGITIYKYEAHNKQCYGINWVDK